jgi:hypothetical protein
LPYTIDWAFEGLRIGGYANGADWVMVPSGGRIKDHGFAGERASATHAWAIAGPRTGYSDNGVVVVLDLAARRIVRHVPFERSIEGTLLASRGGARLYAIVPSFEGRPHTATYRFLGAEVIVLDAHTGVEVARHLIPCRHVGLHREPVVETIDGGVRFPVVIAREGHSSTAVANPKAIATLDPRSGAVSLAPVPDGGRYLWLSPRGRFALRPNLASLPIRYEPSMSFAGIGFGAKTRFYGFCLQLWAIDPEPAVLANHTCGMADV